MLETSYEKPAFYGRALEALVNRLDALTMVLKTCKQRTCRKPWESLHPDGKVTTLREALNPKYDSFYESQPKVVFSRCAEGQIRAFEGPMDVIPFTPNQHKITLR